MTSLPNTPLERSVALTPSGSNRRYFRDFYAGGATTIRVEGTSRAENHAFIVLARHFRALGLPVPEVLSVAPDESGYTQNDLGDTLLFDFIEQGRQTGHFSPAMESLLERTLRLLAHLQIEGAEGLDWSVCYPVPSFDRRSVMWDLNYWKYCFLKGTQVEFREDRLEDDFERLADYLLQHTIDGFMYRDFQSRNVMVVPQDEQLQPYFIDFQGGRRGPVQYDIASFLWQAKANYPDSLRRSLIDAYLSEQQHIFAARGQVFDTDLFRRSLPHFVLFRTLQVLGAYGYRGYFERKPHFLQSIPFALRNLKSLFSSSEESVSPLFAASDLQTAYPYLFELSSQFEVLTKPQPSINPQNSQESRTTPEPTLHITVYSFSYKRGIPADASGNGGGYVFDCRSTHNPGKYERYKSLTGLDQPVIDFLERDGEILTFLNQLYPLLRHHVERYLERGFTHLQICFGCTGGQHRSVYCAEATARYLHDTYHLPVHLIHREQNIERNL